VSWKQVSFEAQARVDVVGERTAESSIDLLNLQVPEEIDVVSTTYAPT
jgi:hypothetical protein